MLRYLAWTDMKNILNRTSLKKIVELLNAVALGAGSRVLS